jgi:hypothetical protein
MKKLTVAVTVDDKMGVSFNKRRQSRDKILIEDLCKSTEGIIYVTSYSAPLFEGFTDRIMIVDNPISECPDGGLCFLELTAITEHIDNISKLIIYRWNRLYPSDKNLGVDIGKSKLNFISDYDFVGKSHDKITKEIYQ